MRRPNRVAIGRQAYVAGHIQEVPRRSPSAAAVAFVGGRVPPTNFPLLGGLGLRTDQVEAAVQQLWRKAARPRANFCGEIRPASPDRSDGLLLTTESSGIPPICPRKLCELVNHGKAEPILSAGQLPLARAPGRDVHFARCADIPPAGSWSNFSTPTGLPYTKQGLLGPRCHNSGIIIALRPRSKPACLERGAGRPRRHEAAFTDYLIHQA